MTQITRIRGKDTSCPRQRSTPGTRLLSFPSVSSVSSVVDSLPCRGNKNWLSRRWSCWYCLPGIHWMTIMAKQSSLTEEEKANLVAYLDGELEGPAARALEAKLNTDPQ